MYGTIVFLGVVLAASGLDQILPPPSAFPGPPFFSLEQIVQIICNQNPDLCDGNGNFLPAPAEGRSNARAECPALNFPCNIVCINGLQKDENGCTICRCNWPPWIPQTQTTSLGKRDLSALNMEYSQLKQYCADNKEKCLKIKDQVQGVCALQPGKCDELMAILSGQETKEDEQKGGIFSNLLPPGVCSPVMCALGCPWGFQTDSNGCFICKCAGPPITGIPGLGRRDLSALNMEYSQLKQYCADNKEKCLKIKDQVQGVCALQPGKCDELMAILSGQETKGRSSSKIVAGGCTFPFPLPLPVLNPQNICNTFPQLCDGNGNLIPPMGKRQIGKASEDRLPIWYCTSVPESETCQAFCKDSPQLFWCNNKE